MVKSSRRRGGTHGARSAAVVLASATTGHSIARSLGRLGIDVFGVYPVRREVVASRYWRGVEIIDVESRPTSDTAARLAEFGQSIGGRPQLMVTSDDQASFVANHTDVLAGVFEFPTNPPDLVTRVTNKQLLHELCVGLGVPTPHSYFPAHREDVAELMPRLHFPVLIKGIDTRAVARRTGKAMALATRPSHLEALYDDMELDGHRTVMIQAYIAGGADTRWMFNAYLNRSSECLFGLTGVKIRENPISGGSASLAVCRRNARLVDEAIGFLEAVDYRGPVDMDYRYDRETDEYKLLDFNPRMGATFRAFVDDHGWDVARVMHADLDGIPVRTGRPIDGRRWLVENSDVAAGLRYLRAGQLGPGSWLRSLRDVEELAWFSRDDPRPLLSMARIMTTKLYPSRLSRPPGQRPRRNRIPAVAGRPDRRLLP